jgi:hypothetical protein
VIFFEVLPDFVILNPRWLIDSFKCLVSAPMFQANLISSEDLKDLEETGRLTDTVFTKLFVSNSASQWIHLDGSSLPQLDIFVAVSNIAAFKRKKSSFKCCLFDKYWMLVTC